MRESSIERYLVIQVKTIDGLAIKLGGYVGIPDRLVILPGAIFIFVELKTAVGRLSPLQVKWKTILENLGCEHRIIRSKDEVRALISQYKIN